MVLSGGLRCVQAVHLGSFRQKRCFLKVMVKRVTQYRTRGDRPIYSENGQFYYRRNNDATWRRLSNNSQYYTLLWNRNNPNNNIANANLSSEGYIANLKRNYNRAARTIQKAVRNRRVRRAATTIQRHVRGTQLRARAGWHNPYTPVGYLALMKRVKRNISSK
jgi:hypothetical protein